MKKLLFIPVVLSAVLFLTGCTTVEPRKQASYQSDANKVEETQKRVQTSVPIPEIQNSAERKNIAERAKLFDKENVNTYVYLVNYGKVMAFYTAKGKVSSLNSYLTPVDKIVDWEGKKCSSYSSFCHVVGAPDIDGAYGENADGIFFFTTENVYVEWKGDYMVSDQPLKLTTPPELVREIK
jgi:hypothetical protein